MAPSSSSGSSGHSNRLAPSSARAEEPVHAKLLGKLAQAQADRAACSKGSRPTAAKPARLARAPTAPKAASPMASGKHRRGQGR